MKRIFAVCLLFFFAAGAAYASPVEEKIVEAIKSFVETRYPDFSRSEMRVEIKLNDKDSASLDLDDPSAVCKVLAVFSDFKPVGNVIFPVEVKTVSGASKIFVRAKVEVLKKIVVAAKKIPRNKDLKADDLRFEVRDVAMLPRKYLTEMDNMLGKETKIPVPAGSTVFEWMIGDPAVIRTGSEVSIVVLASDIGIRADGVALENGYLGEQIKVRKKDSPKILFGKVLSEKEVEVELK
ncbi:flagella basal body P-ring formation protein FlgA [candidate division WOR-1 bacterium RIFOXYA12_FULL_52_29]|uniref:Flagella basal body P-ring formation protein FlgA n=1 Tax=candidate division WOR-1 bacterium RIFOXYC12_FULL_54_18 TaxID=1802584 RepID=A0A1F4T5B7_UNCSA|nr:MAG: flagella basal body P-ring formation protein FlgA [candidate division WOR-1 bacterium RIFOXYA2_FULL_51_19]OGC17497.1 MAG: flagella basal body P-ring formation protein FlgA [candidate division WOR-1 bacterium RIFOXYA12_FULL_52_29]OGC26354.1 MAG: flagella basal body P-ring formation protein FlgA [candidate division WOR-1 bacterium RIFOXYB2_FULL_45_9]OGC27914.1 MAG: flagella basal body P-ring formation protein FlgA [candidate division WOR-1 bacterium RIFOXYC12_FULL_54_18]OGC29799.1 MAG: fl